MILSMALIINCLTLSIAIFIFTINLLKINFNSKSFFKYLIIATIPSIFSLTFKFIFAYIIFNVLVKLLALRFALKISYKNIILCELITLCIYKIILNSILSLFIYLNLFKGVSESFISFAFIYFLFVPLITILISYHFKNILKSYNFSNNIFLMTSKLYYVYIITLTISDLLLYYFSPYNIVIVNSYPQTVSSSYLILYGYVLLTMILIFASIKYFVSSHLTEIENKTLLDTCENVYALNRELHSQKHDFLNHLQVISGMLQLKKYSECFNYTVNIHNFSNNNNLSLKTGLISINALLNSKHLRAKQKNIDMDFNIESQLDSKNIEIQDWEIIRVLGNLIDNAIYAESKVSTYNKYVKVDICEDMKYYRFSVYNKNSYIPIDKKRNIFDSGYSTKGNDGNGMGLYIVKNIIEKYDGQIELYSNIKHGTCFSVNLPKSNPTVDMQVSYPPQESLGTQTY